MKKLLLFFICSSVFADNELTIKQVGDNFDLTVDQVGYSNVIRRWQTTDTGIDGADNTIEIKQFKGSGSASDKNVLEIRKISGTGNNFALGQGYVVDSNGNFSWDGVEYGDTFAHINVTGDYNDVTMQQTTGGQDPGGHRYWLHIEGDNNTVYTKQQGGGQFINLDIFNDDNNVEIRQKNNGDHSATVKLYGTEPTSIYLLQNSWSDQTYSVTNYCYTTGGCSISVTQE
jgi:hypothetical protein